MFDAKKPYSFVWVGAGGKRTIGQQRGVSSIDGKTCLIDSEHANSTERPCYGWRLHNKPLVTQEGRLATGLTAIIYLKMGVIDRIMWDSNCNLVCCEPQNSTRHLGAAS